MTIGELLKEERLAKSKTERMGWQHYQYFLLCQGRKE